MPVGCSQKNTRFFIVKNGPILDPLGRPSSLRAACLTVYIRSPRRTVARIPVLLCMPNWKGSFCRQVLRVASSKFVSEIVDI